MTKLLTLAGAATLTAVLCLPAFANGQGSPVEPAPQQEPVALEPAGPAPVATVATTASDTNWWLIGLGAAAVVGVVVLISDNDSDSTTN
jgi:hypothetical protein